MIFKQNKTLKYGTAKEECVQYTLKCKANGFYLRFNQLDSSTYYLLVYHLHDVAQSTDVKPEVSHWLKNIAQLVDTCDDTTILLGEQLTVGN